MPYADPEKQKAARADWYRQEYAEKKSFRRAEAERKAAWQQTDDGRKKNRLAVARWRAKQKRRKAAAARAAKSGAVKSRAVKSGAVKSGAGHTNGKSTVKPAPAGKGMLAGKMVSLQKPASAGKRRPGEAGKEKLVGKAALAAKHPRRALAKAA